MIFRRWKFIIFLVIIALLGLLLRLAFYDSIPPFAATTDEFYYPWAGMSWIQTGVPTSWSQLQSNKTPQMVTYWGQRFGLLTPWVEKPPLYPIITGSFMLLTGAKDFADVRLSTLRLIPIAFSFLSILLIGLLSRELFGKSVALLASLLYAVTPTIVLANRMSLVENLLTPIFLASLYILVRQPALKYRTLLLGVLGGLAVLTKNTGIALPIMLVASYFIQKQWKPGMLIGLISLAGAAVHPLIGAYYDWELFKSLMRDFQTIHNTGLPEIIFSIFRFPSVTHISTQFLDGTMLAGYISLFGAAIWLPRAKRDLLGNLLLGLPLLYVTVLGLMSAANSMTFVGWYVYPLFPFLTIFLAKALYDFWENPQYVKMLFFFLTLGYSSVRFYTQIVHPELSVYWQQPLIVLFVLCSGIFLFRKNVQQLAFLFAFVLFLLVNVAVIILFPVLYPVAAQPL